MRHLQHKQRSELSSSTSLNKTQSTGMMHSYFSDPQLQRDQYRRTGRNRSSDHLQILARNLDSTTDTTGLLAASELHGPRATDDDTSSPSSCMQKTHTSVKQHRRRTQLQVPPADNCTSSIHGYATDNHPSQAIDHEPDQARDDQPVKATGKQSTRRPS